MRVVRVSLANFRVFPEVDIEVPNNFDKSKAPAERRMVG